MASTEDIVVDGVVVCTGAVIDAEPNEHTDAVAPSELVIVLRCANHPSHSQYVTGNKRMPSLMVAAMVEMSQLVKAVGAVVGANEKDIELKDVGSGETVVLGDVVVVAGSDDVDEGLVESVVEVGVVDSRLGADVEETYQHALVTFESCRCCMFPPALPSPAANGPLVGDGQL